MFCRKLKPQFPKPSVSRKPEGQHAWLPRLRLPHGALVWPAWAKYAIRCINYSESQSVTFLRYICAPSFFVTHSPLPPPPLHHRLQSHSPVQQPESRAKYASSSVSVLSSLDSSFFDSALPPLLPLPLPLQWFRKAVPSCYKMLMLIPLFFFLCPTASS